MPVKGSSYQKENEWRDKRLVPVLRQMFHVNVVEAHLSAAGIPDLNICSRTDGLSIHEWLELKYVKTGEKIISIRATQYAWFRERVKHGGRPLLLVYMEKTDLIVIVEGRDVVYPHPLRTVEEMYERSAMTSTLSGILDNLIILCD